MKSWLHGRIKHLLAEVMRLAPFVEEGLPPFTSNMVFLFSFLPWPLGVWAFRKVTPPVLLVSAASGLFFPGYSC